MPKLFTSHKLPYIYQVTAQRFAFAEHGRKAGVDSAWEQEKLEARKMLESGDESHLSGARGVGLLLTIIQVLLLCISLLRNQ